MPSSSRVATTSAGAASTNRGACSTARTAWRSASDRARGGRGRGLLDAGGAGGRRRRYSVARESPSARQAWGAPRSGATASTAAIRRALLVVAGRVERDPQQLGDFSLDLDDLLRLRQARGEALVGPPQPLDLDPG